MIAATDLNNNERTKEQSRRLFPALERERGRDGSRFTFAYQPVEGRVSREMCRNSAKHSRRIRERRISRPMYGKPSTWPSLSPSFQTSSLSKGRISLSGSVYISKGTDSCAAACRPSYLLLLSDSNSFQTSIPTSQIDPCRDIRAKRDIKISLSLFFPLELVNYYLSSDRNNGRGIISRLSPHSSLSTREKLELGGVVFPSA